MFGKTAVVGATLLLAASAQAQTRLPAPAFEKFAAACKGKDGWSDPAPPFKLYGNVYHVGTCGIVVLLLVSDDGDILIDTGPADAADSIAANLRALGRIGRVKWIVASHEHHDHVGGIARLKRLTGAQLAARAAQAAPLERGTADWRDPQAGSISAFPGAKVDRIMIDGEHLTLGPLDLTLIATPGHAPGSTTWRWRSCEGQECRNIVYADSVSAVSADSYKFSQQRLYVDAFARSLGKIAALPCDILITPHPGASRLHERLAGTAPLADPDACLHYAEGGQAGLEARLKQERGGR